MATYQNDPKDVNQLGMVDDPNQQVMGTVQTQQGQTQQSAPMAPKTGQGALVGGGGVSARKPTQSGQNFTNIGTYLEANKAGIDRARQQVIGDFQKKGQQFKQNIQGGIEDVSAGRNLNYSPSSDIAEAQAEYRRSIDPNYVYDTYGAQNVSQRNTGLNRLDRSILGRAGAGEEARGLYEQEIEGIGDYARNLAKQREDEYLSGIEDSNRITSTAVQDFTNQNISDINRDATKYLLDKYYVTGDQSLSDKSGLYDVMQKNIQDQIKAGNLVRNEQDKNILEALSNIAGDQTQYNIFDPSSLSYGDTQRDAIRGLVDQYASDMGFKTDADVLQEEVLRRLANAGKINYVGGGQSWDARDYDAELEDLLSSDPDFGADKTSRDYQLFTSQEIPTISTPVPTSLDEYLI